jgi:hypothetical protein
LNSSFDFESENKSKIDAKLSKKKKTNPKRPKHDSQNRLSSPIPEEGNLSFNNNYATINTPKVQAPFGVSLLHLVLIIQGYNQNYMLRFY